MPPEADIADQQPQHDASPTPGPSRPLTPLQAPTPFKELPASSAASFTTTLASKEVEPADKELELVDKEATGACKDTRPWYTRFGRSKFSNAPRPEVVVMADGPALVLPEPPTDHEKYVYAQTRRLPLYFFCTISFLSVSAGIWLFAISAPEFHWFIVLAFIIQFNFILAYGVGYSGRDYKLDNHKRVVKEYATSPGDNPADILLPCCGEPLEILANTYKHIARLSYTNHRVHVLDDGGLDTNRGHLKKAGNLRHAFPITSGEFFTIFDADFCPRPDFLQETLPLLRESPDIAILQTPQFFRPCSEQTWVEQGANTTQKLFYRVSQVSRDYWGAPICVGSNAVYRRQALEEVGGTAEIGYSEDVHTGFYAMTRGWRVKYIPLALACGIPPRAYYSQQMRWCSGSTSLLSNGEFWKSKLNVIQKICFFAGMLYYSTSAHSASSNKLFEVMHYDHDKLNDETKSRSRARGERSFTIRQTSLTTPKSGSPTYL
ncbi:nucleotide-diphospho-sugar transferase [Mycena albidolilacea]|uniref:Nucleotide-diphospho-sugar transferase n=1 Tax=Mycena albidolilacea TaxID=1033008 RepID=A0AAD7AQE5_9AGAR|nr:nucleotide-diphospho-sugar transferase [Mycena albidolilacea]